jgi:hypothetical protein
VAHFLTDIFLETADAFYARRRGDHIVSIQNRSWTSVVAMKSYAEAEKSRDHLSRDFLGLFDFRLLQQYPPETRHRQRHRPCPFRATNGLICRSKRHLYLVTLSARSSSEDGTARPSALAVLRLTISSDFVGACTPPDGPEI